MPAIHKLGPDDLPAVMAIQALAYPELAESEAAMRSRLCASDWCRGLKDKASGELLAYLLCHPWSAVSPPHWNQPLPELSADHADFYLHDLALAPAARGRKLAEALITATLNGATAAGFRRVHLVAVQNSVGFWSRMGFTEIDAGDLQTALASYGDDARHMQRLL